MEQASASSAEQHAPCACPRCAYDLAGEAARWNAASPSSDAPDGLACPLDGACPECGLVFRWRDVMRPGFAAPVWFVETPRAYGRRPRSVLRTTWHALLPWRFWRAVRMETPLDVRRQAWWLAFVMLTCVATPLLLLFTTLKITGMTSPTIMLTPAGNVYTVSRDLNVIMPEVGRMLNQFVSPFGGSLWFACLWMGVFLYPMMLLLLSDSRRNAKIRIRQVVRGAVYSITVLPAFVCVGFAVASMQTVKVLRGLATDVWAPSSPARFNPLLDLLYPQRDDMIFYPLVLLWFPVWWGFALRSYRMKQVWIVWLSMTIPSLLIQYFLLVVYLGYQLPGWLGRLASAYYGT